MPANLSPAQVKALVELLLDLFDETTLRHFVATGPEGDDLKVRLPGSVANQLEVAVDTVELWQQRGHVDSALFARLEEECPKHQESVRAVRAFVIDGVPIPRPDPGPSTWIERFRGSLAWAREHRGALLVTLVSLLVPVLLAATQLLAPAEMLIQDPTLRLVGRSLQTDDVVVVAIPGDTPDIKALRGTWPKVIAELVQARARVIVFDLAFSSPEPQDLEIAQAIRDALDRGVPVLVAVPVRDEQPIPPGTPELASAARLGIVQSESDTSFWRVRRMPPRLLASGGDIWWHLSVRAAHASLGTPLDPEIVRRELVVGSTRNPLSNGRLYLPPSGPVPSVSLQEPETWERTKGKIAVIGLVGGTTDLIPTPSGPMYGVEVLSVEIQTILRQAGVRAVGSGLAVLVTAWVFLGTMGIGAALPRKGLRPLTFVVVGGTVAVSIALAVAGILLPFLSVILAGIAGYLAISFWKKTP